MKCIGKVYCEVIIKIKLSLWSSIKLRIAGINKVLTLDGSIKDLKDEITISKGKII